MKKTFCFKCGQEIIKPFEAQEETTCADEDVVYFCDHCIVFNKGGETCPNVK